MSDDVRRISRRSVLRGGAAIGAGIAALSAPGATALAGQPTADTIELAHAGRTSYRIYVGKGEDVVVRQAADELAQYLGAITSAHFPVVVAPPPPGNGPLLVVGRNNPVAAKEFTGVDYQSLGDDGFVLRTSATDVLIAGNSSRGTLYGAYWVLDRLLGVRWLAADYTTVPHKPDLTVAAHLLNDDQTPRYRYREIYAGDANDPAYRQHNFLNGGRGQYENVSTPAGIDTWSDGWSASPFGGTFQTMVPDQSLWYGGQLLCMDPRTRETAAASLIDVINKRIAAGQDPSYGFEQADRGWTLDPASQAFANAHGGAASAPMIDMVNDVFARVRAQIPAARLSTQAYQFSFPPPTGITVADGVTMTVAPINADFGQSLFAGDNAATGAQIASWCDIAPDVLLWDYITSFASYIVPFPDWWAMCEGIAHLAQYPSAQGYFGESAYNAAGTELSQLRIWVLGRLLWDPTLDPDNLIREFLNGYYGKAGPLVYQYLQVIRNSILATNSRLPENITVGAGYFTFDAMRQADSLLARAEAEVRYDAALVRHVRSVRLGVDYVILVRTNEYIQAAAAAGIDWNPDTAARLTRFESEVRTSGLTVYNEGGGTAAELLSLMQIAALPAAPPKLAAGLPAADWIDYQEQSLTLYAPVTTLVQDSLASNTYAVRMPGNRPDWGVQLPLGLLPADGTWKLYVSVRADTGTAGPTEHALELGVYPPFGNLVYVPVSALSDGQYHEIAAPGTYQRNDSLTLYVAPPNSADVTAVYIDRVFAIKM